MTTTRRRGTAVERYGWALLALLTAVITVFGLEAFLDQGSATDAINGSLCCTGHRLSEGPPWVFDYAGELGKYLGTYMVGAGLLGLAVVLGGLRRARRWAWVACWYIPVLFGVHGFLLGSFPFDIPTFGLAVAGQLLMIRPVFAGRAGAEPVRRPEAAGVAG
jgi:hypothetical protein